MNLAIFTPALATSAIGRSTRLVVDALVSQGHQIVIVRAEDVSLLEKPTHEFGVKLIAWNDAPSVETAVNKADMLVYQIGNNYQFHRGCMEWMPVYPGIVCLHDFFLGHLFHDWAHYRRPVAEAVLEQWYGADIAEQYFSIEANFIENTQEMAPMTEWISSMALAVVTHSSWAIHRVLSACPGPVHVIALAYDLPKTPAPVPTVPKPEGTISVLTVGHINRNKRPHSVIKAIGNSPSLRDIVSYRLVGLIEPSVAKELADLAAKLQVSLAIFGEVDASTLNQEIENADVVCCLRWPALEAASASAIESMLYGKATIVMDTGFYRELPDQYVQKISTEDELSDLQAALESLCMDKNSRVTMGHNAALWATKTFNAQKYATSLISICESTARSVPVLEMSQFYSNIISAWGTIKTGNALCEVASEILIFERVGEA
jgi:glycosyltransferase involved in cell wall biosynthesis